MNSRFARVPVVISTVLLAVQLWAGQINQGAQRVFTGEITDTFCAKNKSHNEMMSENKTMGTDKQTCAQRCVQMGAKYVLLDSTGRVYKLDDQAKAAAFAGLEVRVMGTLQNDQLNIASIHDSSSTERAGQ
jgi:hypothetical protein